jgi:hypothetical protein
MAKDLTANARRVALGWILPVGAIPLALGTAALWIASESLLGRYWRGGSERAVDR